MILRLCVLSCVLSVVLREARADVVNLADLPSDQVWRCANSKITPAKDSDGTTMWRWEIGSGEAFLWINEDLPIHKELQSFQRFNYDVKFAEGQIDLFWPRTMGVLKPPFEKMFCEWNLFYFTHPHKQWITYQQILNDPTWFAHWASQIPEDIKLDRTHFLGIACLGKGQSCVVELRNCRLVRDVIRVEKPFLTTPIGWPVLENDNGAARYRTPYFVKNVSDKASDVVASVKSDHKQFKLTVDPPRAKVAAGATQRFDVLASIGADLPVLAQETAVVEFIPDGNDALSYRTETFCTAPLPKTANRMIAYSPAEVAELKQKHAAEPDAEFWMSVDLAGKTETPKGIGHILVVRTPIGCPKCGGDFEVTHRWLEAKCNKCGHTEYHTLLADAAWIACWSEIHRAGPNPLALARAYLATGDERYAKKAIELLTLLASNYSKLTWHNAAYPEGGWTHAEPASPDAFAIGSSARWGNAPTYDTNFMVQDLAMLHNGIVDSPSWSDAQRKAVLEGFWVPVVTEMAKIIPGISNMNDIINRDLILAGFATGDANMVYRSTFYPTGLVGRMKDITPDGFSDEGSALNYHLAAMHEWFPSIELLINTKLPFGDITDRAIAALKMPLLRAGLNGATYCTGNSGRAWFMVGLDHPMFQLADHVFPPELWPRERHYSTEPILFRDAGWAVMRTGEKVETQIEVNVDFGRSHGHGDLDRMNLGLQAFGMPLSADPGSTYNYDNGAPQGPAAASMDGPFVTNTVIVDGQPQLRGGGTLVSWDPTPAAQRLCAQVAGVYPGVGWRRNVALIDGITIVIDDVQSEKNHRYESAWHHYGRATAGEGCAFADLKQPLGEGQYQYLLNPKQITGESVSMDWLYKDVHVRVWQPAEPSQLTYTAQTGVCWDSIKGLPIDGMYARREGKATRFITILEPYKSQRVLKNIASENNGAKTKVKLTFANGTEREMTFDAGYLEGKAP